MSWQEQRRLDAQLRAEQARLDAVNAAQVEAVRTQTQVQAKQALAVSRAEQARARRAEQRQTRVAARARRAARWAGVRGWVAGHTVDLMIYPLAVVSAVMAVPAMAAFGREVYGTAAGLALPVITELGMWAFAFAVYVTRHRADRDGVDRPVWALQTGVWSFAAVAAGLNFLHGATVPPTHPVGTALKNIVLVPPLVAGVVMAVASVAGVLAHQLVTAAPRRGRAEQAAARMQRRTATKLARVRRAAVRAAVAQIDDTGTARLVFNAGHYRLTRPRFGLGRRTRLAPVTVPGLPVTPVLEEPWSELDRELAAMLATMDPYPDSIHTMRVDEPPHGETAPDDAGGVAMLDHGHDHADDSEGPTPIDPTATSDRVRKPRPRSTPGSTQASGRGSGRRSTRSIEELRIALRAAIEIDPESIDPASAESIRRALRCSPSRARELRDSWKADQ
jgi:hypothetical protein